MNKKAENNGLVILIIIGLAIGAYFYFTQPVQEPLNEEGDMLVVNLYDVNGNPVEQSVWGTQSVVGGTPGVFYINFDVVVQNTGEVPMKNVDISSKTPTELATAFSAAAPVSTLSVGQSYTWSSALLEAAQFEGSTTNFAVTVESDYIKGDGSTGTISKSAAKSIEIQPDTCAGGVPWGECDPDNAPQYCSSGTIIDKASVCGCPAGYDVVGESCVASECSDGTAVNTCTASKPDYCTSSKTIVEQCSTCGCPDDYYGNAQICQSDGSCIPQEYNVDFVVSLGY